MRGLRKFEDPDFVGPEEQSHRSIGKNRTYEDTVSRFDRAVGSVSTNATPAQPGNYNHNESKMMIIQPYILERYSLLCTVRKLLLRLFLVSPLPQPPKTQIQNHNIQPRTYQIRNSRVVTSITVAYPHEDQCRPPVIPAPWHLGRTAT